MLGGCGRSRSIAVCEGIVGADSVNAGDGGGKGYLHDSAEFTSGEVDFENAQAHYFGAPGFQLLSDGPILAVTDFWTEGDFSLPLFKRALCRLFSETHSCQQLRKRRHRHRLTRIAGLR